MQHLMTSRDGRSLDVLLGGNPNASVALVCHHGTPSDASIWTGWNEDALEHNLRLVAISRPGYAHSQRKKGRSVSCVVADVEDVLDELGIDCFLTVGWSGGGPHALSQLWWHMRGLGAISQSESERDTEPLSSHEPGWPMARE